MLNQSGVQSIGCSINRVRVFRFKKLGGTPAPDRSRRFSRCPICPSDHPEPVAISTRLLDQEACLSRPTFRSMETQRRSGSRNQAEIRKSAGKRLSKKSLALKSFNSRTRLRKMEAAGIEPASRDASTRPSTCVVEPFVLHQRSSSLHRALFDRLPNPLTRNFFNPPRLE